MALSIEKSKSETRYFAKYLAILIAILIFSPWRALTLITLICLAPVIWLLVLHGTTTVSFLLKNKERRIFQIFISIIFPLTLSSYFLKNVSTVDLNAMFLPHFNSGFAIALFFITWISWKASDQLDDEHPFRGFLIASLIMFVICYFSYHDISFSEENSHRQFMSEEETKLAASSGMHFGQYLIYVTTTYAAMLSGIFRRNRQRKGSG